MLAIWSNLAQAVWDWLIVGQVKMKGPDWNEGIELK
jgi:hypothetical protein